MESEGNPDPLAVIGTGVGAMPGAGGTIAAFVAYNSEKVLPSILKNLEPEFLRVLRHRNVPTMPPLAAR